MSQNVPLFEKIIRLRQEEAELLGYKNHAVLGFDHLPSRIALF